MPGVSLRSVPRACTRYNYPCVIISVNPATRRWNCIARSCATCNFNFWIFADARNSPTIRSIREWRNKEAEGKKIRGNEITVQIQINICDYRRCRYILSNLYTAFGHICKKKKGTVGGGEKGEKGKKKEEVITIITIYGDNTFRAIVEIRFIRVCVECILSYRAW